MAAAFSIQWLQHQYTAAMQLQLNYIEIWLYVAFKCYSFLVAACG